MLLFSLFTIILSIGLLSSQISTININRIAIIVFLLSGVLASHAETMWVGQLGSGVGIFNGLFPVTPVTQGIDLFIYIVGSLVLLMSETGVKTLQLNKDGSLFPLSGFESSSVNAVSIGSSGVSCVALRRAGDPLKHDPFGDILYIY